MVSPDRRIIIGLVPRPIRRWRLRALVVHDTYTGAVWLMEGEGLAALVEGEAERLGDMLGAYNTGGYPALASDLLAVGAVEISG